MSSKKLTGSFVGGIYFLCFSMTMCATIIFLLGLGKKETPIKPSPP